MILIFFAYGLNRFSAFVFWGMGIMVTECKGFFPSKAWMIKSKAYSGQVARPSTNASNLESKGDLKLFSVGMFFSTEENNKSSVAA